MLAVPLQAAIAAQASAAETGTWVDGDFPKLTVGTLTDARSRSTCSAMTFKYQALISPIPVYTGYPVDVCATTSAAGEYGNSSSTNTVAQQFNFIKIGQFGHRIVDFSGRERSLTPVPGGGTMYLQPESSSFRGQSMRFFDNPLANGNVDYQFVSGAQQIVFRLNLLPPAMKFSNDSPIMINSMSFSNNGDWLVAEALGHGIIRVNTRTRDVVTMSNAFANYDLGFGPSVFLAISDDGNTVIKSGFSGGAAEPFVYDLTNCQTGPVVIRTVSTGCRGRSLNDNLRAQYGNTFATLHDMHFSADGKLVTGKLARYVADNRYEHYDVTLNVAGYVAPKMQYLALGDSFSSGEGAHDYESGTDSFLPLNICHLSRKSYPHVAASATGINDFHNVACSGAMTNDYYQQQDKRAFVSSPLGQWLPGYQGQYRYIQNSGTPSVVTISMLGNDIGFDGLIKRCVGLADSCYKFREDRRSVAEEIHGKWSALTSMYEQIKLQTNNKSKVYVLGYPQLFATGSQCTFNAQLDPEERQMSRGLITYMNSVIRAAANQAGFQYVDMENSLGEQQLCGANPVTAVNGLTAGDDIPVSIVGPVGRESFHPNAFGQQLMADKLLAASDSFTKYQPGNGASVKAPYTESAEYKAFVDSGVAGGSFVQASYYGMEGLEFASKTTPVGFVADKVGLTPNSPYEYWLHSTPVKVGNGTTDANGDLNVQFSIPASVPAGYHTLHIVSPTGAKQKVDLYKTIYVAENEQDIDGDGVANDEETCLIGTPANVDKDKDGIDDACDGEVPEAPADSVAPVVTGTPDRQPNAGGWYDKDVTIIWNADDADPSSGAPTQPANTVAGLEGGHTYTSAESCDPAGNCATGSLELKIDKSAPVIDFSLSSAANAEGWHDGPVTVTFNCQDSISGVADCSAPVTVEEGGTIITGGVTDKAGNVSSVNVIIAIDSDKPVVTNRLSVQPNAAGWHNTDVTVTPDCSDFLSGLLGCTPATAFTSEGAGQVFTATATDKAGNSSSTTTTLNLDKTSPALGNLNWRNNPKTITGSAELSLTASDNLSGVTDAEYFLGDNDPGRGNGATMLVGEGKVSVSFGDDFPTGVYKVSVRTRDAAGNWSVVTSDYLVVYDPSGVRMTSRSSVTPSLSRGDILPGLVTTNQTDSARFGFNVRYDDNGQVHKTSDFQFVYSTGTDCNRPAQARNCHSFNLNATSVAWLTTQGVNASTGIFQGTAALNIDGVVKTVVFRLTGVDGERLNATAPDNFSLRVFEQTADPNTAQPLYKVTSDVSRGNIRVRTE